LCTIGLLAGSYNSNPVGFDLGINTINTRDGLFFGTLFFAIGVAFCNLIPRLNKRMAAGMALAGLAIYCLEAIRLRCFIPPIMHDYLLGMTPYGVGASLLVIHHSDCEAWSLPRYTAAKTGGTDGEKVCRDTDR
jgi:hypothetical protein